MCVCVCTVLLLLSSPVAVALPLSNHLHIFLCITGARYASQVRCRSTEPAFYVVFSNTSNSYGGTQTILA